MKKVLFINPPNTPITSQTISIEPIDILQLATYTRSLWHEVKVLDLDVPDAISREEKTYISIQDIKPDIIICLFDYHIPLHVESARENVLALAKIAKTYHIKVLVWWKMATYMPQKFIYGWSDIDIAIRYDMEAPLEALLANENRNHEILQTIDNIAYLHNTKLHCTARWKRPVDISALPIPDRSLIDTKNHIDVRTMLTSRGCMMKCSFCHVPWFRWKRQWRTVSQVVDEMEYLACDVWTKKILFLDDNATVDTKRMTQIADEIMARKLKVSWWCLSTIHSFSVPVMQKMRQAWCRRIHYGIESADTDISKSIHKFLDEEKIINAVLQTKEIWIRVRTSRIMDLPGTTKESLQKTLGLMNKLQTQEIRIHFLVNRLWSELYREPDESITTQYIHHNAPTQQKAEISPEEVMHEVNTFIEEMKLKWYKIIDTIDKNEIFHTDMDLNHKCISLCPLQYGINR